MIDRDLSTAQNLPGTRFSPAKSEPLEISPTGRRPIGKFIAINNGEEAGRQDDDETGGPMSRSHQPSDTL